MEKYLYLFLNIGSLCIPLLYSFEKKMRFIQYWKAVLTAITLVASFFIFWDIIFTEKGVWGFNKAYHLPYLLARMPLEEWLFFFCIPYASIFIHYSLAYFKPQLIIPKKATKIIVVVLLIVSILITIFNLDKSYTMVNFMVLSFVLSIGYLFGVSYLQRFFISFLIILIPFFIVNGILTGTGVENPIVWYNNEENLTIRIGTIPIEDIAYTFSLLFPTIMLIECFKKTDKNFLFK